jgi:CTP:molybdopterin cytidylyltransferase MocA
VDAILRQVSEFVRAFIRLPSSVSALIAGIVLAAGQSSRMGTPKALLELRGETFLARTVDALRAGGCDPVIVVTGSREDPTARGIAEVAEAIGASVTINPVPESEQIDSLRRALAVLVGQPIAVVVTPVDSPDPPAEIVERLLRTIADGAALAIPTFGGRRGHPLALAGGLIPELMDGELPEGLRTIIRRHEDELVEVRTDDSRVLLDVDTPEDYQRLVTTRS